MLAGTPVPLLRKCDLSEDKGQMETFPSPTTLYLDSIELTGRVETVSQMASFISGAQSCPTLCDPMNRSMPGLPVHHQLLEFTQTYVN